MLATARDPRLHEKLRRIPEDHGTLWNLVENAVADLALESTAKQIATTSLTSILASPASTSGASVAEADGTEY